VLTIHYCECCRRKICEHTEVAFEVFEVICEFFYLNQDCIEFCTTPGKEFSEILPIVNWLESKQIVVTTECSVDWIKVKPLGVEYYRDDEGTIARFCLHCKD
jgi:hypothetical protein